MWENESGNEASAFGLGGKIARQVGTVLCAVALGAVCALAVVGLAELLR